METHFLIMSQDMKYLDFIRASQTCMLVSNYQCSL